MTSPRVPGPERPAQEPAIDSARRTSRDAASLANAVDWENSGWPAWKYYAPIAQIALDADLPIIAAGLSTAKMRAMMKPSPDGASPPLDEGEPLTPDQRASLTEELRASHCGQLPETMLPVMIRMQRARDAASARSTSCVGSNSETSRRSPVCDRSSTRARRLRVAPCRR